MLWDDDDARLTKLDAESMRWLLGVLAVVAIAISILRLTLRADTTARPVLEQRSSRTTGNPASASSSAVDRNDAEPGEREAQVQIMQHRLRAPARVKRLQLALKRSGFDPGPVNGEFTPQTEAALAAFQRSFNLEPEGMEGLKTWAILNHYVGPDE